MNRSPFDVPASNECNECEGKGYTFNTAQRGDKDKTGMYVTTAQGSGCPSCLGVGRLVEVQ
jgi:hypothetical protein